MLAQTLPVSHLREGHSEELIGAREGLHFVVASVALDAAAKSFRVQKLDDLGENGFGRGHRPTMPLSKRRKTRPRYRSHRFSSANIEQSGVYDPSRFKQPDSREITPIKEVGRRRFARRDAPMSITM